METSLAEQDELLLWIEDRNRITIGSIKMPVNLSGIVGAASPAGQCERVDVWYRGISSADTSPAAIISVIALFFVLV